jgi:hypothetical protein
MSHVLAAAAMRAAELKRARERREREEAERTCDAPSLKRHPKPEQRLHPLPGDDYGYRYDLGRYADGHQPIREEEF